MWLARVLSVGLRSRGSVAGLNGRTITRAGSGRRWSACRFRKVACNTVSSARWSGRVKSSAHGAQCGEFCQAGVDARELTNFRKTKEIGYDRFAAAIFVGAIGVQSIAATAGVRIDQRHGEIVAAEKPRENARCHGFPLGIAIRPPRREAGSDRRRCFHGLLIESTGMLPLFAETGGADPPRSAFPFSLFCLLLAQGHQTRF